MRAAAAGAVAAAAADRSCLSLQKRVYLQETVQTEWVEKAAEGSGFESGLRWWVPDFVA